MLVTGVLTTGDRYHSKVSDLHGFAVPSDLWYPVRPTEDRAQRLAYGDRAFPAPIDFD